MSAPPQNDRIEIWRYLYAKDSLLEASEAAKFLLATRPLSPLLQRAVVCHLVVAYARPFTESQLTVSERRPSLTELAVPAEFRDLHKQCLEIRNWAIAHKDATALPSTLLNRVVVRVCESGVRMNATLVSDMPESALHTVVRLCERLVAHCEAEVQKYSSHFSGVGRGVYYLSLEKSPSEWLEKKD
jgi:hypothetical protein